VHFAEEPVFIPEYTNYLPICAGISAAAVLIQICVLIALLVSVRNSISRIEVVATELKTKVTPVVETVKAMVAEMKPKVTTITANIAASADLVRHQMARVDATFGEMAGRTHLQVIRAENFMNRTTDHIDETSKLVRRAVSPLRRFSVLFQRVTLGLEFFRRRL
jgi:hypothetical protein